MQRVKRAIARTANVDAPILLFGEPGTGKEHVARAIHCAGPRHDEPFVIVDCAALTSDFGAGSLIGLEREWGAGTLFLDGVGEMPAAVQPKLLRFLEERGAGDLLSDVRARARVIASTNCDLESAAQRGAFRLDLLHRLNTLPIRLPSLAERGAADIEELLARPQLGQCRLPMRA
jgi:DNA-binding NtrC family response regulator